MLGKRPVSASVVDSDGGDVEREPQGARALLRVAVARTTVA
jgi:hypothetical protein